jgi:Zn-dependent protease with chaperone function
MALVLMIGFYVFALAIAGGLLWIPYADYMYAERVHGRLAFFCVVGAGTILWALVPRIDKFVVPGPRLTPANAPELFTIIHDVAKTTGQARPEEVYLLGDVNAWVAHRGGVMGFGSRRLMGVGLPLINGLSQAELRSVIAHEFGHYVSGDVALGPWIHKTRGAIGRALHGLSGNWLLTKVFEWYGNMFMRMTMQVSREQEFVADATAARVAGVDASVSALKRVEVIAPAYQVYVNQEVMPVLRAGYLPPVSEGFQRYLADPETHQAFQSYAHQVALGAEAGEFDTHPPTAERIAALQRIKQRPVEAKPSTASLLKEPDRHARALLEHDYGRENVVKLKSIAWTDVGTKVYAEIWQGMARDHAKWLGTLTADRIPADKKWFLAKGVELAKDDNEDAPADQKIAFAVHVLSYIVGAALLRAGWTIDTAPGRPLVVIKGEQTFEPRAVIAQLADESLSAESWKAQCQSLGLTDVRLAAS